MRMIVAFEKTPRVRHIGHLDLLRAMQRALRRSGLPIRYSQGFNPHVVLSFASPLSVGMSGAEELMDVALDTPVDTAEFARALSVALPESLPLIMARPVDDRHPALMAQLRTAAYTAALPISGASTAIAEAIAPLLARDEIIALRRTKSGEKPCDIRPMLHELRADTRPEGIVLHFRTSLTERETLKPDLLLRTLAEQAQAPFEGASLHRVRLFGEKDGEPVPLADL